MHRPEVELLVALCRSGELSEDVRAGLAPLGDPTFRARFVAVAQQHAVLGLALTRIEAAGVREAVPSAAGAELARILGRLRRRAALWVLERDRVLTTLRRVGIEAVMLKGGALCTTLYPEPVQREFGDLDLLVARGELEPAVNALLRSGYVNPWNEAQLHGYHEHHFHIVLEHPNGFVVEVHFALTAPGVAFRLDPAEFIAGAQVRRVGRMPIRLPRPEHLLLHVVSQNTQDGFQRLVRFVDIDRIVRAAPDLDWTLVEGVARHGRMQTVLALSLQLAHRILGTTIPETMLARIRPGRLARYHMGLLEPLSSVLTQRFQQRPAAAISSNCGSCRVPRRAPGISGVSSSDGTIRSDGSGVAGPHPTTCRAGLIAGGSSR